MRMDKADFYEWAFGNTLDNTNRAIIAEYLVHSAVGGVDRHRLAWNAFDIETPEGITIEVKATGQVQSWTSKKPCTPDFDIAIKLTPWLARENRYLRENKRIADIWVFAVHNEEDLSRADPYDTEQWQFFVTTSKWLEREFGSQKRVRLSVLVKHGLRPAPYDKLRESVLQHTEALNQGAILDS